MYFKMAKNVKSLIIFARDCRISYIGLRLRIRPVLYVEFRSRRMPFKQ
jgi:hypothetical protein